MSNPHYIRFKLHLDYEQFLAVYQGIAKTISVIADDGRRVVFPAMHVQPFLTPQGIHGHFELQLTERNKFVAIKRLAV